MCIRDRFNIKSNCLVPVMPVQMLEMSFKCDWLSSVDLVHTGEKPYNQPVCTVWGSTAHPNSIIVHLSQIRSQTGEFPCSWYPIESQNLDFLTILLELQVDFDKIPISRHWKLVLSRTNTISLFLHFLFSSKNTGTKKTLPLVSWKSDKKWHKRQGLPGACTFKWQKKMQEKAYSISPG